MEKFLTLTLCLVLPGLFIIGSGVYQIVSNKGHKQFYMTDHIYTGRIYAAIPFGIAFLTFALAAVPQSPDISLTIVFVGGGFVVLGLIFAFTQPSFLKPGWLKWLEREHRDIIPLLRQEADQMGLNAWNERIQNQEDLEEWVAEVRRKHGV